MTPRERTPTGKGLTVAKNKVAILLRLPKSMAKVIGEMAARRKQTRTAMIYRLLATHPELVNRVGSKGKKHDHD
jgi:hypothetical protein